VSPVYDSRARVVEPDGAALIVIAIAPALRPHERTAGVELDREHVLVALAGQRALAEIDRALHQAHGDRVARRVGIDAERDVLALGAVGVGPGELAVGAVARDERI